MIDDLTLKARLMAANPNDIEKLLSRNAGGNRREAWIPGYANRKYGKEQADHMQTEGQKATRAKKIQTTQERQNANLLARQTQAANNPNMIYPTTAPKPTADEKTGRSSGTEAGDRASLSESNNAQQAHLAAQGVGGTDPISTPSMPGGKNNTDVPDKTESKRSVVNGPDGATQVQDITTHKNDEVPTDTEQGGGNPEGDPNKIVAAAAQQNANVDNTTTSQSAGNANIAPSLTPAGPAPAPALPAPALPAPPMPPQAGQMNTGGQQNNPVFNIGTQGQGQGQGQAPQNDPRTNARNVQVANATARSQKRGGVATNPLLGAATFGVGNMIGAAYNWNERRQGKKELGQLEQRFAKSPYSKVLSVFEIRKGISARNTTEVLRRGRI